MKAFILALFAVTYNDILHVTSIGVLVKEWCCVWRVRNVMVYQDFSLCNRVLVNRFLNKLKINFDIISVKIESTCQKIYVSILFLFNNLHYVGN